jgi:hypothetical protein
MENLGTYILLPLHKAIGVFMAIWDIFCSHSVLIFLFHTKKIWQPWSTVLG